MSCWDSSSPGSLSSFSSEPCSAFFFNFFLTLSNLSSFCSSVSDWKFENNTLILDCQKGTRKISASNSRQPLPPQAVRRAVHGGAGAERVLVVCWLHFSRFLRVIVALTRPKSILRPDIPVTTFLEIYYPPVSLCPAVVGRSKLQLFKVYAKVQGITSLDSCFRLSSVTSTAGTLLSFSSSNRSWLLFPFPFILCKFHKFFSTV